MTATPDILAAVVALLAADTDVAELAATRVYGGELPPGEAPSQPRTAVVVRAAGSSGSVGGGYQQFGDRRYDIFTYGATPAEADHLGRAVYGCLKHLRREVWESVLLHAARPAGGPNSLRDPDTGWPYSLATYQVVAAEVAVE